jgi:uncharacterized OB-fold protein
MSRKPIADNLFTWPDDAPQLVGARCPACAAMTFPQQASCPRCGAAMDRHLLGRRGRLWTWTVQSFEPKPPYAGSTPFEPYGVGYVELPGELLVESRLTEADPERLEIGAEMELVIEPFRRDDSDDGDEILTFAFRLVDGRAAS